jgi:hypothetical protein
MCRVSTSPVIKLKCSLYNNWYTDTPGNSRTTAVGKGRRNKSRDRDGGFNVALIDVWSSSPIRSLSSADQKQVFLLLAYSAM